MTDTRLPANLPENWEPGQIIAPTGTEVGLSEQHGYNYLMKQVNDSHRVINGQKEQLDDKVTLLTEPLHLYVSKEGDDETGDGTEEKPFLTIQKAVDTSSMYYLGNVSNITVFIHPGVYRESIMIRNQASVLTLCSATENKEDVIIEGDDEHDTTLRVRRPILVTVRYVTLKGYSSQTSGVVSPINGGSLALGDSTIESDGGGIGAHCGANSHMHLNRVEINNCDRAVSAGGASFIHATNLTGTGNKTGYVANGGIITRNGTYVSAATDTATSAGGQVWPNSPQEFDVTFVDGIKTYFPSTYSKDSLGYVHLYVSAMTQESKYFKTGNIATLPAGFWPKQSMEVGCTIHGNTGFVAGSIIIRPNGVIDLQVSNEATGHHVHCVPIVFLAR